MDRVILLCNNCHRTKILFFMHYFSLHIIPIYLISTNLDFHSDIRTNSLIFYIRNYCFIPFAYSWGLILHNSCAVQVDVYRSFERFNRLAPLKFHRSTSLSIRNENNGLNGAVCGVHMFLVLCFVCNNGFCVCM